MVETAKSRLQITTKAGSSRAHWFLVSATKDWSIKDKYLVRKIKENY